ncbi:MAG: Rieske 2Fe-2S domain-containing protein [Deltaproteobacteria bacterium]|nr:Rieske 2Fe-2S domain-containing protein [Deltaproteobacteria bacterium]
MDREVERALVRECIERVQQKRPTMDEAERLVSVEEYRDPARFELEMARLFRPAMNVVGHTGEIENAGDFVTRELHGAPALLVRQDDGSVKAFLNVCRHRGATVELRQSGHCKRFVCPYHAWTYSRDGALASVRFPEGFPTLDIADTKLVELPCREIAGLLFVGGEQSASALPDGTDALAAELTALGLAEPHVALRTTTREWKSNWKLIVDGGLEAYHFRIAHKDTIAGFFPDNVSLYALLGDHLRTVLPRKSVVELEGQPEEEWRLRKHTHLVYNVAPNATLLVQAGHFELIRMTPLSVDTTRIDLTTLVPTSSLEPHLEKATAFFEANHAFSVKTLDEDFSLGEQIQRGLHTNANEHFRFARYEGALGAWHDRVDHKLG